MRINAERERISRFKVIAEECALTYYNILEAFSKVQEKINHGHYEAGTHNSISNCASGMINASQIDSPRSPRDSPSSPRRPNDSPLASSRGNLKLAPAKCGPVSSNASAKNASRLSLSKMQTSQRASFIASEGKSGAGNNDDPNKAIEKKIADTKLMNMITYITDFIRSVFESGYRFTQSHFFILLVQMTPEDLKLENHIGPFIRIVREELDVKKDAFDTFVDGLHDPAVQSGFHDIQHEIFAHH